MAWQLPKRRGVKPGGWRNAQSDRTAAETTTFLAALRHDRIDAPWLLEGPIDGESFRTYLKGTGDPYGDGEDIVELSAIAVHCLGKVAALGVRHDEVLPRVVAGCGIECGMVKKPHDVGVRKRLDRFDLVAEAAMARDCGARRSPDQTGWHRHWGGTRG